MLDKADEQETVANFNRSRKTKSFIRFSQELQQYKQSFVKGKTQQQNMVPMPLTFLQV
jgi:hypothetical protein